jgi:RNA polymerase sigma-70 factor (ECF subfamily)
MLESLSPLVPALRRYARALLRERTAADDLVQECLERAIERWHQRRAGDPRAWLFAILHNLAISQLRQSSRRGLHVALDESAARAPSRAATQELSLQHAELLRALAELTEEHRAVLLLVSVEDLSYAEAAHVLDVPVGTVMSRLSRARTTLSRLLDAGSRARPVLRRLK